MFKLLKASIVYEAKSYRVKNRVTLARESWGTCWYLKPRYYMSINIMLKLNKLLISRSINSDQGPNMLTCSINDRCLSPGVTPWLRLWTPGSGPGSPDASVTGPPSQHCDASPHQGLPSGHTRRAPGSHPTPNMRVMIAQKPVTGRWQPIVLCPHTT